MRNVPLRTASLCVAFILLGKVVFAQSAAPTPQEEERAREALRAALDGKADEPSTFDPHSAKTWNAEPPADIAPGGLPASLFEPSTEIQSVATDRNWLPGTNAPQPSGETEEQPQEDRAATASTSPNPDIAEPPSDLARPAPRQKSGKSRTGQKKVHSTLRSGRAALDTKSAPRKKSAPQKKSRPKADPVAPQAPVLVLPGELLP